MGCIQSGEIETNTEHGLRWVATEDREDAVRLTAMAKRGELPGRVVDTETAALKHPNGYVMHIGWVLYSEGER